MCMNKLSLLETGKLVSKANRRLNSLIFRNYDKQYAASYILTQITHGRFEFYLPFNYNQGIDSEKEFFDFVSWLENQKIKVSIIENNYQACKLYQYYPDICEHRPHWSKNKKCKYCIENIYKKLHLLIKIENNSNLDIALIEKEIELT